MSVPAINDSKSKQLLDREIDEHSATDMSSLVAAALGAGIEHPMSEQVMALTLPSQDARPFSDDPEVYFQSFQVAERGKLLKPRDIQDLRRMLRRHSVSNTLCLHDFFGMEIFRLLKEIQPYLPKREKGGVVEEWGGIFALCYNQMLRFAISGEDDSGLMPAQKPIIDGCRGTILSLNAFTARLKKMLGDHRLDLEKTLSPSTAVAHQANYARLERILKEWDETINLLKKFLFHPQPTGFLNETVIQCPASEEIQPSTEKEAVDALPILRNYIDLMALSVRSAAKNGIGSPVLCELTEELQKTAQRLTKKNGRLVQDCYDFFQHIQQLSKTVDSFTSSVGDDLTTVRIQQSNLSSSTRRSKAILSKLQELEKKAESTAQLYVLSNLMQIWVTDLRSIMEHSVLSHLDPKFVNTYAYCNRMFMNLLELLRTAGEPIEATGDSELDAKLSRIHAAFKERFKSKDVLEPTAALMQLNNDFACPPYGLMMPHLQHLLAALSPFIGETLNLLKSAGRSDLSHPDRAVQTTIWFSRILILANDIENILEAARPQEDILPVEFLEFLSSPESPPPPIISRSDSDLSTETAASTPLPIFIDTPATPLATPPLPSPTISDQLQSDSDPDTPALLPDPDGYQNGASSRAGTPPLSTYQTDSESKSSVPKKPTARPARPDSRSSKQKTPSPPLSSPHSTRSSSRTPDPREILQATKVRQIEDILVALGLQAIRQRGGHVRYEHPDTGVQTTVSRHGTVKPGTRKAIFRQVTGDEK